MRVANLRLCFVVFLLAIGTATVFPSSLAAENPEHSAADRCRRLLEETIVDFYLPACLDTQHGGYLETLDNKGQFQGSEKFLTLQARQLWFFSSLAIADIRREEALAAAKSGYSFLVDHFYDSVNGGYFAKTSRQGLPTDRRKHVYHNAFVIYALVEYHRATGDDEPLDQAMSLFQTLESHAYDQTSGGYIEFFDDDWRPVTDPNTSVYIGAIGTKTYNSHLHLMEAFAPLFQETNDPLVGSRLSELIQVNTVSVKLPDYPCNVDAWHLDWQVIDSPKNLRTSYGHDVECVWLVLDAAESLGRPLPSLLNWAKAICDNAIQFGHDSEFGGFYYTGPVGKPSDDRKKEWWTQAEALVAMLTMAQLTGDTRYRELFDRTLTFIEQHQVSPLGGWWASVNEDGSVSEQRNRTSMWQGAYHNGRALLLSEKMLRASPVQ